MAETVAKNTAKIDPNPPPGLIYNAPRRAYKPFLAKTLGPVPVAAFASRGEAFTRFVKLSVRCQKVIHLDVNGSAVHFLGRLIFFDGRWHWYAHA